MHAGVKSPVFKKYKISGGGYKQNVRCPNCQSGTRNRLLGLYFSLNREPLNDSDKILHISPNRQLANLLKSKYSDRYEVGAINVDAFREYHPILLDVQNLPMTDSTYGLVICNHVLEHVKEDQSAMKEIYRVLKPGGHAILQVPLAENLEKSIEELTVKSRKERKREHGQEDHLRLYGKDYFERLKNVGFKITRDDPRLNNWLTENEMERHGLDLLESVILAIK